MADLSKLRETTKDLTVLYVEDSAILLKKMTLFLGKIFKEVYQAPNGLEGYESFKKLNPDIIITDLNMPVMSGHEMIKRIKADDPEANIIIYSAYADSTNLLESIHLGVVDFIPKPVDIDLFEQVLSKVVSKNKKPSSSHATTTAPVTKSKRSNQRDPKDILKKFELIEKSHKPLEFINHYKGVPIYDKGTIYQIEFDAIVVEVPYLQNQAIKYERKTVIDSELLEQPIEATLKKINSYNNKLVLGELRYLDETSKKRKQVSVEPDRNFSIQIHYQHIPIECSVQQLSSDFVIVNADMTDLQKPLDEGDELDLELEIIRNENRQSKSFSFETRGEIYFIDEIDAYEKTLMLLFELEPRQKDILEEYINTRRQELIIEFKQMKN